MSRNLTFKYFTVVCLLALMCCFTGCQPKSIDQEAFAPVFFPPPPNQPRLQFLMSFSGRNLENSNKVSFLETYVFGEDERTASGMVSQPYGVTIHKGKLYICDVGDSNIKVIDLNTKSLSIFPGGKSLKKPTSIFIDANDTKYIADTSAGAIIVYDKDNKLIGVLGSQLGIKPNDIVVQKDHIYFTDINNNQVYVLNKRNGELVQTVGRNLTDKTQWDPDQFALITGLALDEEGNIYVTDKLKGLVTKFDQFGSFMRTYSRHGSLPDCLVRAKGIDIDKQGRLWVVDAGPAMAAKVYRNEDGRFLMIFGLSGTDPGQMYMPADIDIDYDNVEYFKQYAVEGAELEFIVLVTNQYGPHKVSVYGFGTFPEKYANPVLSVPDNVEAKQKTETAAQDSSAQ